MCALCEKYGKRNVCVNNQFGIRLCHGHSQPQEKILDSNDLKTTIHHVCYGCGVTANVLTCLQRYGQPPKQLCYSISTYHKATCDFCKEEKEVTETRDFFYPDFGLIPKVVTSLKI
jgi:hypothetical protein